MTSNTKVQVGSGFGILSFVILITFLVIGFFGGDQRLMEAYPEHKGGIAFIADIIRLAFWIILILIIVTIVAGMIFGVLSKW